MEQEDIRILLVEDDEDGFIITRDLLREIEGANYRLDWANNYKAAITAIKDGTHDIYLVDYRLGWRSGLDLLREAKRLGSRAPIILLTGQGTREIDIEAMKAGAADYLVKGEIDAYQLERSIRYAIERKRSEEALKRERDFVFAILDTVDALVMVLTPNGRIVRFNRACERTTGFDSEEVEGKPFWDLFLSPREAESVQALYEDLRPVQFPNKYEKYWVTKDRRQRLIAWSNTALLNDAGEVEYVISTGIDITEKRQTGEVLRIQQDFLRKIIDADPSLIYVKDRKGRFTLANQAVAEFYGTTVEEIMGKTEADYSPHREEVEHLRQSEQQVLTTLQKRDDPEETLTSPKTGAQHAFRSLMVPLIAAEDGEAYHLIGVGIDRTQVKESETTVLRLRKAVEASSDALLIVDARGRAIYQSKAFHQLSGYTTEELNEIGGPAVLYADSDAKASLLEAVRGGQPWTGEVKLRAQSGREIPIALRSDVVRDDRGRLLGWVTSHLTGTGRAEEALREHEERYRLLADTATDMIARLTPEGVFIEASPASRELLLYEPAELVGRSIYDFILGQDVEEARRMYGEALRHEDALTHTFRVRRKDGRVVWLETDSQAVRDPLTGRVEEVMAVSRDVSEQKLAEEQLRWYADRLERTSRELQDFAYVASHDLQEPLRKIEQFGERLATKYNDALGDQGRDYLGRMQSASGRMRGLINDLLVFSRVTTRAQPFVPVNLHEMAQESVAALHALVEKTGGRVEIGELPPVEADPAQMRQLFQGLIENGLKFHREGVPPVIRISGRMLEEGEPRPSEIFSLEELCQILFEDNGIGFEERYRDRIFMPFQRLHGRGEYEGTGMGLAIGRKIVERHGGTITARSVPGQGSTFIVTLPVKHADHTESQYEQAWEADHHSDGG